ncbi:MAG: mechanosensitive ion channel family protein [Saprospiraceae bacterium]|nr:mechanosensitive ion channel family protein [Saprospiraceae bacterium]
MLEWISDTLGISSSVQGRILLTILVLVTLLLVRRLALRAVRSRISDPKVQYKWRKGSSYFVYVLSILIIAPIWISEFRSMGTFLGLLSAGLAIALKDPVVNIFAWAQIIFKKPFEMGDRIEVGNNKGDVVDIDFFQFTILEIGNWVAADQSTGRLIHIPNGIIFNQPVFNFNQAMKHIWHEIPILITYESNWQRAKEILSEVARQRVGHFVDQTRNQLSRSDQRYTVIYRDLEPSVITNIEDSGVLLTVRYLCDPQTRRTTQEQIMEDTLISFSKHADIELAYPTRRFISDHSGDSP